MKSLYTASVLAAAIALLSSAALASPRASYPDAGLYPDGPFGMYPGKGLHGTRMTAGSDAARIAATSDNPKVRCSALESQFDHALADHQQAKKVATAKVLRREGMQLCASGKPINGIKKLEQALIDINVKPYHPQG